MSEECSDYIDCKVMFRRALESNRVLKVIVTRHAVERLIERIPKKFKKLGIQVLLSTIKNVIEGGECRVYANQVVYWTKNYVLISVFNEGGELVIKTVITRDYVRGRLLRIISRRGLRVEWSKVIVYPTKAAVKAVSRELKI